MTYAQFSEFDLTDEIVRWNFVNKKLEDMKIFQIQLIVKKLRNIQKLQRFMELQLIQF